MATKVSAKISNRFEALGIEIAEPPQRTRSLKDEDFWTELADLLKEVPGTWVKAASYEKYNTATGKAHNIRNGSHRCFGTGFTAKSVRNEDGSGDLFVRFGSGEADAE